MSGKRYKVFDGKLDGGGISSSSSLKPTPQRKKRGRKPKGVYHATNTDGGGYSYILASHVKCPTCRCHIKKRNTSWNVVVGDLLMCFKCKEPLWVISTLGVTKDPTARGYTVEVVLDVRELSDKNKREDFL